MLNFLKQSKSPVPFFIIASIALLVMFPIFLYFFKYTLIKTFPKNNIARQQNQYYPDNIFDTSDSFITKVLTLKDLIDGPIINNIDPSIGNDSAPIVIVEFSDFECDFCRKQEKVLNKIIEEYGDRIRLIWKDYPIDMPASASYQAAAAARCAGEQNKFWEYHNLLFEKNNNFNQQTFLEIARELKLNSKQFKKCAASDKTKKLIDDNIIEANALGINGVPFIFVNKQKVAGKISLDELRKIIEAELKKQKLLQKSK